jgi:hypothetical protein
MQKNWTDRDLSIVAKKMDDAIGCMPALLQFPVQLIFWGVGISPAG